MTELPKIEEFPKVLAELQGITSRMPGVIRKLESKIPDDLEIARKLDRDASDPVEGAINPFDITTKDAMKPVALKLWVEGDGKHDMQVFGLPGESESSQVRIYGFGGATIDNDRRHPTYDPGFARRAAYVKRNATLSASTQVREYNFWDDRADSHFPENYPELRHDMTVSWVAKHLVSLFDKQMKQQGDPNTLAFFMSVEKSDLEIDGRVLKDLGFRAMNEQGIKYDNPTDGEKGDDTLFCLTFDKFTEAMRALDEKMRTSPKGSDSRMESGLDDDDGTVYYGLGESRPEVTVDNLELKPVLNHQHVEELLDYIDNVRMTYNRADNIQYPEHEWLLNYIKNRDARDPLRVKKLTTLINARFGAGAEDYRNVREIVTLGAEIINNDTTSRSVHPSKSTLHIYNEDTHTLQTKRIFLVKDNQGNMQRVEVYSREVYPADELALLPSGEYGRVLNFRAAETSEEVALLQYVMTHNVEVLGWVPLE